MKNRKAQVQQKHKCLAAYLRQEGVHLKKRNALQILHFVQDDKEVENIKQRNEWSKVNIGRLEASGVNGELIII